MKPGSHRPLAAGLALFASAVVGSLAPAAAQNAPPVAVSLSETPQFYVLSFTDQPIADVAEQVIGGALSQSASVDPAIDGVMSFRAEGMYTPDDLLAEFGEALMARDVALVRSTQGDLALVLRANLENELARGAAVVTLSPPATPMPRTQRATVAAAPIVYGRDRWQDGPLGAVLLFLLGALAGAAGLRGAQILRARRTVVIGPTPLMIAHDPQPPRQASQEDAELTIPTFKPSNRT